jgi:hypothetical protein
MNWKVENNNEFCFASKEEADAYSSSLTVPQTTVSAQRPQAVESDDPVTCAWMNGGLVHLGTTIPARRVTDS